MKMIDVLSLMAEGKIKKDTKLIVYDGSEEYSYRYSEICRTFFDESHYEWFENHGASIEVMNSEVKLIGPQLYYLKMPNSERVLGVYNDLIVFKLLRNIHYNRTVFLFTQDEIESLDILAPYRNFEWSEYHESMDS